MENTENFPKADHVSVITASIMVSYALLPFLQISSRQLTFTMFGILISLNFNFYNLISLITAALAIAGTDWMLHEHPNLGDHSTIPHLILPALTAGAIGIPLGFLSVSPTWWIILGLGSLLVFSVLIGEYISVDRNNQYFPIALMVLSAVSFGLFLIITIAVRAANLRLFLTASILPIMYTFFSLRVLQLRTGGSWPIKWTAVISLAIFEFTIGLYYWPLSPVRFGLLLLGPAYALVGITSSLEESPALSDIYMEPLVMLGIIWLLAIFLG
ncbi:MAG: hypothetical protein J7K66_01735 [Anaerolineaceae bacterium]|nr:hypothetical protein [Anaerolineaceae bacterium]